MCVYLVDKKYKKIKMRDYDSKGKMLFTEEEDTFINQTFAEEDWTGAYV